MFVNDICDIYVELKQHIAEIYDKRMKIYDNDYI